MAAIKEQTITSWSQFDAIVKKSTYRKMVYRGHSDANWKLESSLHRAYQNVQEIIQLGRGTGKRLDPYIHEEIMMDRFKSNAHLFLTHLPQESDDFSWLALMQHYGAPTRLLDFTFSPYIAAFFCLETGNGDAAIYSLQHGSLKVADKELFEQDLAEIYQDIMKTKSDGSDALIYSFEPKFSNQRLMMQQGVFLVPNCLEISHEELLENYSLTDQEIVKYIIPAKLRMTGIKHLHKMNITANIIYPGLEGFCKSMTFQPIFNRNYQKRIV